MEIVNIWSGVIRSFCTPLGAMVTCSPSRMQIPPPVPVAQPRR